MAASGCIFVVDCQPAQAYTFAQSDQESVLVLVPAPASVLIPLEGEIMAVNPQPPQCYTFKQCEQESIIGIHRNSFPRMDESLEAESIYYSIMDECEQAGVSLPPHNTWPAFAGADADTWLAEERHIYQMRVIASPWNRGHGQTLSFPEIHSSMGDRGLHKFFRCLYEYCPEAGRANVLRLVLFALFFEYDSRTVAPRPMSQILPLARVWSRYTVNDKHKGYRILQDFAKDILTSFFLPFRMKRERAQIPLYHISVTPYSKVGLEQDNLKRRRGLAALCFERDGARCVITGKYHRDWALGKAQQRSIYGMTETEVAYIIPQTLNNMERDGSMSRTNNFIWHIINMFDIGLSAQLEAHKINTPMNAMLMDKSLCESFGKLQWYLEEVPGTINTYSFHTFTRYRLNIRLPFERITFSNHEGAGTPSDLPSPRLLRFHRLCCLILNMSGAAEYVEHLFRENARLQEQGVLSADGRSNLDLVMGMNAYYNVFPFWNEELIHGEESTVGGTGQGTRAGVKRERKRKR